MEKCKKMSKEKEQTTYSRWLDGKSPTRTSLSIWQLHLSAKLILPQSEEGKQQLPKTHFLQNLYTKTVAKIVERSVTSAA